MRNASSSSLSVVTPACLIASGRYSELKFASICFRMPLSTSSFSFDFSACSNNSRSMCCSMFILMICCRTLRNSSGGASTSARARPLACSRGICFNTSSANMGCPFTVAATCPFLSNTPAPSNSSTEFSLVSESLVFAIAGLSTRLRPLAARPSSPRSSAVKIFRVAASESAVEPVTTTASSVGCDKTASSSSCLSNEPGSPEERSFAAGPPARICELATPGAFGMAGAALPVADPSSFTGPSKFTPVEFDPDESTGATTF